MPSRPDLREIASNVKDAFADADRETLLDILTFVIKEYVVEGPPPMMIHQAETLADLQGQSFAQLITALQTRCDHPELAMFVVDGEQVGVRVGGVVHPLLASRQPQGGTAADLPRPPGVRVVETTLQQRPQPAPQAAPAAPAAAPPPTRGLSIRGQPGASPQPSAPAQPQGQAPAGQAPAQPATAAVPTEKPESSGERNRRNRVSLWSWSNNGISSRGTNNRSSFGNASEPSAATIPLMWSRCVWVKVTVRISSRPTPASAKASSSEPIVGSQAFAAPASIRTRSSTRNADGRCASPSAPYAPSTRIFILWR